MSPVSWRRSSRNVPGNPAGIMVLGLDASLASAIDKCIDAKVPVVTVDVDVPGSKRLSIDW